MPAGVADQVLAKCGRRCCVCRRFAPLHLQVHHIVKKEHGGTDDFDNLIAVCLTCHSDIHTKTALTRRFTPEELKLHRNGLYRLIEHGVLPTVATVDYAGVIACVVAGLSDRSTPERPQLSLKATELLLKAASDPGGGELFNTFGKPSHNDRRHAALDAGIKELAAAELVTYSGGIQYVVTHKGYLLADEIMAKQVQKAEP